MRQSRDTARARTSIYRKAMLAFRAECAPDVCVSAIEEAWRIDNVKDYVKDSAHLLRVTYVGVWDTVGALGIPRRFTLLSGFNQKHRFHDANLSDFVRSARHAVAIDEAGSILCQRFGKTLKNSLQMPVHSSAPRMRPISKSGFQARTRRWVAAGTAADFPTKR